MKRMQASVYWKQALAEWAIPPDILAAAPESPWGFPTKVFAQRADAVPASPTPSTERALEALPEGGAVLDVGCGAGAGALPLASRAGLLIGVDPSAEMLAAFRERAERAGTPVRTIEGAWPDVAKETPVVDVAVCHHVVYNVPDLAPFLRELSDHARRRVVLELTERHPLTVENDLWRQFHHLTRPTSPTADDVLAVLREIGASPHITRWQAPARGWSGPTAWDDLVAWTRRRLCLPAERDAEIAEAIRPTVTEANGEFRLQPRAVATIWWDTTPPRDGA
jgi:SAM-dependent methyltransferase